MAEDKSGVLESVLGNNTTVEQKIEKVRGVYDSLNLSERCRLLEEKYAAEAIECLNPINMSEDAREFFNNLAFNSLKRIK